MAPFNRGPRYSVILAPGAAATATTSSSSAGVTKTDTMDAALDGRPFVYYNFVEASNLMDSGLDGRPFVYVGGLEDLS